MKLVNTLTNQKDEFKPIDDKKVGLYTCGPTVYDAVHIGNLRTYIFSDLLKRALINTDGYSVKHVMNITDIEDKIIRKAEGNRSKFEEVIKGYEKKFWADVEKLKILKPDIITHVTAYVDKIANFIGDLMEKGFAYKTSDGSIYFSIAKFKDYGKLARLDKENLKAGARVAQDEYDKENPADFALWKAWDEEDGEIFWETKLGKGRPGWHIECSVMSTDTLGDTIDIHTGAVDLIFPHHENEIAQSEAKTGKKFVNFWVHGEHLLVDNRKMSKSLSNFYTLDDIEKKGFEPLDFRYLVLGAHYRSKLNFTWEALEAAKNARERLKRFVADNKDDDGEVCQIYKTRFNLKIDDDLNTPEALAVVWDLVKDVETSMGKKIATLKYFDDTILGFGLFEKADIPTEIAKLAEERKAAREAKDYAKSDELRKEIEHKGWKIEDLTGNNYKITKS